MIQLKDGAQIENPREYDAGAIEHLRHLLSSGIPVQRDLQRENFYEISGRGATYYIHISPVSGNVILLAKWLRQLHECCSTAGQLVA